MPITPPPYVEEIVPGLHGRGVLLVDAGDHADVALTLLSHGFRPCTVEGVDLVSRSRALPALATALHLGGAADHNLDALADQLRDLPELWPGETRLACLWRGAEQFIEGDPETWEILREILSETSEHLRGFGLAFETLAFVEEYDVPPLMLGLREAGQRYPEQGRSGVGPLSGHAAESPLSRLGRLRRGWQGGAR